MYIVGAQRTPVGMAFKGALATVPAVQLGVAAVQGALKQAGVDPKWVEDCYFGQVLQAGSGQSPARQVALGAGCPVETEATTINKVSRVRYLESTYFDDDDDDDDAEMSRREDGQTFCRDCAPRGLQSLALFCGQVVAIIVGRQLLMMISLLRSAPVV